MSIEFSSLRLSEAAVPGRDTVRRVRPCRNADAAPVLPTAAEAGSGPGGLVGRSAVLQAVLGRARKVAPTDSTVLITGETGTGKELLARAIHRWSQRAARPFVSVNCAAIPHTLIASELFGHERGAFTGALQRRQGRFELAAGGTLFLDEVGELPAETQVALLRVLQEREFERVGGTAPVRTDVRIVAATNRDLEQAIADGAFRSDLYYRLNVFPLELPPLRARVGDIRLLVEHFVSGCASRAGKTFRGIDPTALELLEAYPWPGNVRELQNIVERSTILCESELFSVDESWLSVGATFDEPASKPHATREEPGAEAAPLEPRRAPLGSRLDEIQREVILEALHSRNWVIGGPRGAGALLGLKRTTLQARMKKLGITQVQSTGEAARGTRTRSCGSTISPGLAGRSSWTSCGPIR
jgi:transcriptional regulator with GAF, ATPase, and Fis domain